MASGWAIRCHPERSEGSWLDVNAAVEITQARGKFKQPPYDEGFFFV
jgi:hypothetical protein